MGSPEQNLRFGVEAERSKPVDSGHCLATCVYRKLDSAILVVKAAEDRM